MKNLIVSHMKKLIFSLLVITINNKSLAGKSSLTSIAPWDARYTSCVETFEASAYPYYELGIDLEGYKNNQKPEDPDLVLVPILIYTYNSYDGKQYANQRVGCYYYKNQNDKILSSNNNLIKPNQNKDSISCGSEINFEEQTVSEQIPINGSELYLNYSSRYNNKIKKNNKLAIDYNLPNQNFSNLRFKITPVNSIDNYLPFNLVNTSLQTLNYFIENNTGLSFENEFKKTYDFQTIIEMNTPSINFCHLLSDNSYSCSVSPSSYMMIDNQKQSLTQFKSEVYGLKGWTISALHYLDSESKTLFTGFGEAIKYTNVISLTDPILGEVDSIINKYNNEEIFLFDKTGRHLETRNSIFNTTIFKFNYNSNNTIKNIQNQFNQETSFYYDELNNISKIIAFNGVETIINSNATSIYSVKDSLNLKYDITYYDNLLLKTFKSPSDVTTTFSYDDEGSFIKEEKNNGLIQYFTNIANNNVRSFTKYIGSGLEEYTQSYFTNESKVTLKNNAESENIYKKINYFNSLKELVTNEKSTLITEFADDSMWGSDFISNKNFTFSIIESSQNINIFSSSNQSRTYLDSKNPLSLKNLYLSENTSGISIYSELFSFDDLSKTTRYQNNLQTTTYYYPTGLIKRIEPYNQYPSDFNYDHLGRLTKISKGTQFQSFGYDQYGYLNLVSNHKGQQTKYLRNSKGQILETTLPNQDKVSFEYTAGGEVKKITTPNNQVHQFQFDLGDYIHNLVTPNNKQTVINYDSDKRVTDVQKPSGQSLTYVYKNGSQTLDRIKTSEGDLVFNSIDAQSRIRSMTSADNIKLNVDWVAGQIQQQKWFDTDGSELATLTYNYYSDQFRIKDMLLNGQSFASYTYDKGRVQSINSNITYGYPRNFTYSDEITTYIDNLTVADQRIDSVDGDKPSHIINATIKDNPELQLYLTLSRSYDNLGQATEFTTSTLNTSTGVYNNYFSLIPAYDDNNRLIQITKSRKTYVDSTETNSIDFYNQYLYPPQSNNNIKEYSQTLSLTNPPVKRTIASHDNDDQLLQLKGSINRKYVYTDNGELKSMTNCFGTVSYEYDSFANLKKITLADGTVIEYKVDGFNRRVKKLVNGVAAEYYIWYDQTRLAAILDSNKHPKLIYIYGPESSHSPSFIVKDNHTYKIIHDPGTGSVRYVVDPVNTLIMQELEYDEFGNMMKNTNPDFQPITYTGGLYDKHTKFVKLGARDYDSTIGRWTTPDPIGFNGGDTNLYAYVGGNPMSYVDPSGHFGIAGALIGGGFGAFTGAIVAAHNGSSISNGAIIGGLTGASIGSGAAFFASAAEVAGVGLSAQIGASSLGASLGGFFGNLTSQALINNTVDFKEVAIATAFAPLSSAASTAVGRGIAGELAVSTSVAPVDILTGVSTSNKCYNKR